MELQHRKNQDKTVKNKFAATLPSVLGLSFMVIIGVVYFSKFMGEEENEGFRFLDSKDDKCTESKDFVYLYIFLIMYASMGLFSLHQNYFNFVLHDLADHFDLDDGVLGATFMAIASSAPELTGSLVDQLITRDGIGTSTIIGAGITNLLLAAGICCIKAVNTAKKRVYLDVWLISREIFFYALALIFLVYTLVNERLRCVFRDDVHQIWTNSSEQVEKYGLFPDLLCHVGNVNIFETVMLMLLYLCYVAAVSSNSYLQEKVGGCCLSTRDRCLGIPAEAFSRRPKNEDVWMEEYRQNRNDDFAEPSEGMVQKLFGCIAVVMKYLKLVFLEPLSLLQDLTIVYPTSLIGEKFPQRTTFRLFVGFFLNLTWMVGLSGGLYICASRLACLLELDPVILGFTVLPWATSIIDIGSSYSMAATKRGDAAVVNLFSSNIFNIFIGLGFPWTLGWLVHGGDLAIPTNGVLSVILYTSISLLLFIIILACTNCTLTLDLGYFSLVLYIAYFAVAISSVACAVNICLELNCDRCGFSDPLFFKAIADL